jgi:hypothetical protein
MVLTVTGGFTMNVVTGEFERANVTRIVTEEGRCCTGARRLFSCPAKFNRKKNVVRKKNGRGA